MSDSTTDGDKVVYVPTLKDDVVKISYGANASLSYFKFVYAKCNGDLYYYVGDTIQNQNLIDVAQITSDLSKKINYDELEECEVIVDKYSNGASGYRIWSDGYCEQWGYIPASTSTSQVNRLLKTMRDTNYNINITAVLNSWSGGLNSVFDLTVNSFKLWTSDDSTFNSCPVKWQVSGYLAEGEY